MIIPEQFLPHTRPMLMIDEVLSLGKTTIEAACKIRKDCPFLNRGQFPVFYCTEIVAQASGILFGSAIDESSIAQPGAIIQIRRFDCLAELIYLHDELTIQSSMLGGSNSAALFEGKIFRDKKLIFISSLSTTVWTERL